MSLSDDGNKEANSQSANGALNRPPMVKVKAKKAFRKRGFSQSYFTEDNEERDGGSA